MIQKQQKKISKRIRYFPCQLVGTSKGLNKETGHASEGHPTFKQKHLKCHEF